MRDKRYWDKKHPQHVSYVAGVTKAFEDAFGTGEARRDATGRLLPASDLLASRRRISAQPGTQGGAPQQRTRPDGRTVTGSDRDGKKIKLPDKSRATIPPGFPREKEDEIVEGLEKDAKKRSEIQNNIIGFFRLITGMANRMKDKEKKPPLRDKRGGTRW